LWLMARLEAETATAVPTRGTAVQWILGGI
jgi:hypothetical protein